MSDWKSRAKVVEALPPKPDWKNRAKVVNDFTEKRESGISDMDRFLLKNFFDTQPEKRKQFLSELGFETNLSNDNLIRPIGSDGEWAQIDKSGLTQYFKEGGLNELTNDFTDLSFDVGVQGPAMTWGAMKGGAAGAAVGSAVPVAGTLGVGLGGAMAGGAAGYYATEELKNQIANIMTQTDVPMDRRRAMVQSAIAGIAPPLIRKGAGYVKAGVGKYYDGLVDLLKGFVKKGSQNAVTNETIEHALKNIDEYTPEAVDNAAKNLRNFRTTLFGAADDKKFSAKDLEYFPKKGIVGEKLKPIFNARDKIFSILDESPEKYKSGADFVSIIDDEIAKIRGGNLTLNETEQAAIGYLQGKRGELMRSLARHSQNMTDEVLNKVDDINANWEKIGLDQRLQFLGQIQRQMLPSEQYKFINDLAKHTYNTGGQSGSNPIVMKIGGQLKNRFYDEVGDVVPLREVNQKLSNIQKYYTESANSLGGDKLRNLVAGKQTDPKLDAKEALDNLGREINLNLRGHAEKLARKSTVDDFYKNANSYFSDREAMNEILRGASKGSGLGLTVGFALGNPTAGAVIGSMGGATAGKIRSELLRSPEKAFTRMSEYTQKGADWGRAADKTLDNTTFQYLNYLLNSGAAGLSSGR